MLHIRGVLFGLPCSALQTLSKKRFLSLQKERVVRNKNVFIASSTILLIFKTQIDKELFYLHTVCDT